MAADARPPAAATDSEGGREMSSEPSAQGPLDRVGQLRTLIETIDRLMAKFPRPEGTPPPVMWAGLSEPRLVYEEAESLAHALGFEVTSASLPWYQLVRSWRLRAVSDLAEAGKAIEEKRALAAATAGPDALQAPATAPPAAPVSPLDLGEGQAEPTEIKLNEPPAEAIAAYRLSFLQGQKQGAIAKQLSAQFGRKIGQGQVFALD